MRKGKIVGLFAIATAFLLVGCSGSVETGPVPTITPRATVTPVPTPTPVVVVETTPGGDVQEEETVYDTKKFKEYYEKENELPQLKVVFQDNFEFGLDVLQIDVTDEKRNAIVKSQFGAIGVKEDFSPTVLMDYEATRASGDLTRIALDFTGADVILKFAQENNLPVHGPALINSEAPEWAFTKNFDEAEVTDGVDESGQETKIIDYADAAVMTARMENYIKDIIEHCNTNYPGLVVTWQVLEIPTDVNAKNPNKYAENNWYKSVGEDYIIKAFEYARASATAEQKLFFAQSGMEVANSLNIAVALANVLKEKNLIDGIGVQAHYTSNGPSRFGMDDMMKALSETGLEIYFTEFYIDSNEGSDADADKTHEERWEKALKRYKNVMTYMVNYDVKNSYNIVRITFDGLTNDTAGVNQPKEYYDSRTGEVVFGVKVESFPYFFDAELNVMDTLFAAMGDVSIKAY